MKISRITGKKLTEEDLDLVKLKVNESIQYSFHHLVKTPNIRKRTFLMCYLWQIAVFPAGIQRCFYVHTALYGYCERQMDVETTLCASLVISKLLFVLRNYAIQPLKRTQPNLAKYSFSIISSKTSRLGNLEIKGGHYHITGP